jgi:hypothetical protein
MVNFEFSYDQENDDLFLFRKDAKSKGSIEFGNLVLDFDSKKMLVGLQIMDATDFISEMTVLDKKTVKEILINLESCKGDFKPYRNMVLFKIVLFSKYKKETPVSIMLPNITTPSPAITYA